MKEEWDLDIKSGAQRHCPSCKVGGMKDFAYTYMKCEKCKTEWCYICEKPDEEFDKEDPEGNS
jgi:uncharacterized protein (DUF983 family)